VIQKSPLEKGDKGGCKITVEKNTTPPETPFVKGDLVAAVP